MYIDNYIRMYCPECGVEVREDQNYCHVCGTHLRERKTPPVRYGAKSQHVLPGRAGFLILLLLLGFLALLHIGEKMGRKQPEEVEKGGTMTEALDYTQAYHKLELAISSGNLEEARRSFELFTAAYAALSKRAGSEHINIIVPPRRLRMLNLSLREGNLTAAEKALSKIGSTCGIELCHARGGSVMYDFASEYYYISRALERNSTEEALSRIPAFRRHFYSMKEVMAEIMPEKTEQTMREEYILRLEDALRSGDLKTSKDAMEEIKRNMCSVDGCHSIILTAKLEKYEEVER